MASANPAFAADQIGVAVTVRNDVTGKIQSETLKIDSGSGVFGKEIVKTQPDSTAKIVLKDSTNINVGPNSSLTLDNFVFAGENDYKKATFNLAKGALRFTSGNSDKRAYEMKTPYGTIGVRGTEYILVGNKGYVVKGQVVVCVGDKCQTFFEGQSFTFTPKGVQSANWGPGLANFVADAGMEAAIPWESIALGGPVTIDGIPIAITLASLMAGGAGIWALTDNNGKYQFQNFPITFPTSNKGPSTNF